MAKEPQTQNANTPALPDFKDGVQYGIQLSKSVEFPPGSQNILRPDQDHIVDGFLARILKDEDAISGAREV